MDSVVAVVLARGVGSRMQLPAVATGGDLTPEQRRAADAGQKVLMPMAVGADPGRPFLDHVFDALVEAGFGEVVLVVAPDHGVLRDRYTGRSPATTLAVTFAVQTFPLGTADAVRAATVALAGRDFIVVNGDNLYPVAALMALRELDGPACAAFERDDLVATGNIPADRIASFAVLDVSSDGRLLDVHEKPSADAVAAAGPKAAVSMNCWRFDSRIFEACANVPRSPRGEFELTAAVRLAVERGVVFRVVPQRGPVLDLSRREDVPAVAARLATRRQLSRSGIRREP
jgi:glucose-1-phosphate thymidylyltransferase